MPYGGRHPYEIASLLCCIEAREALLRGLFFGRCQNRKTERKNKHICRIGILLQVVLKRRGKTN